PSDPAAGVPIMARGRVPLFFFFQAEDGIRDRNVTGVQTCALPIFTRVSFADDIVGLGEKRITIDVKHFNRLELKENEAELVINRSEERRVGKECRSGGAAAEGRERGGTTGTGGDKERAATGGEDSR